MPRRLTACAAIRGRSNPFLNDSSRLDAEESFSARREPAGEGARRRIRCGRDGRAPSGRGGASSEQEIEKGGADMHPSLLTRSRPLGAARDRSEAKLQLGGEKADLRGSGLAGGVGDLARALIPELEARGGVEAIEDAAAEVLVVEGGAAGAAGRRRPHAAAGAAEDVVAQAQGERVPALQAPGITALNIVALDPVAGRDGRRQQGGYTWGLK